MPTYQVEWLVDVEASTPREAAQKAQEMQQTGRPDYWAGCFKVTETDGHNAGVEHFVDLNEDEGD